ncbi:hypothetical protein [Nonomuraea sp. C10]|uniref:hypothetical protein n=1 Tax=Nonomuraea sp. C10 TaxID=2600577 RepID=UPI0011CD9551|nr:hypothetical protein [Nonomuraea sp. C10]TXK39701.1 hypothetical protein FR742_08925 [Nonomuraea sp. C10]
MKTTRAWIALIAAAATMSACGQPEFHYVRDRDGTTYFKVPSSFSRLDASPLERLLSDDHPSSAAARLRRQQVWSAAYDQAARPAVEHLFGSRDPFVYVTVRKLTDGQRNEISLNRMRDFLLPVTEQTRTAYLMSVLRAGRAPAFSHFEPLMDRELTLGDGARGVRVRYNYRIGGEIQTFDQTVILDGKGTSLSVMFLACEATCFTRRAAEFDQIAGSFNLLRLPG